LEASPELLRKERSRPALARVLNRSSSSSVTSSRCMRSTSERMAACTSSLELLGLGNAQATHRVGYLLPGSCENDPALAAIFLSRTSER
jgi:hypothetical protein